MIEYNFRVKEVEGTERSLFLSKYLKRLTMKSFKEFMEQANNIRNLGDYYTTKEGGRRRIKKKDIPPPFDDPLM